MTPALLVGAGVEREAAALRERGIEVRQVDDVAAGEAALAERDAEVLVVELAAPEGEGVEWLRRLRGRGHRAAVVLVTPSPEQGGAAAALAALMRELKVALVLHRPLAPAMLAEHVALLATRIGAGAAAPSPAVAAAELAPGLEQLRRDFAARLPAKLSAVAAALVAVRSSPGNTALIETATRLAHRLHGTAGAYGFPAVGEAAGRFEEALTALAPAASIEEAAARLAAADGALAAARAAAGVGLDGPPDAARPFTDFRLLLITGAASLVAQLGELARENLVALDLAVGTGEATDAASRERPDAALIDLQLGESAAADQGAHRVAFELLRSLREQAGLERLPIGFVSTTGRIADRIAAARAGGNLFLVRPLDPAVFIDGLRRLRGEAEGSRSRNQPRVLVVDADVERAAHLQTLLQAHEMHAITLADPTGILEVLERELPDLVLLESEMPGVDSTDLCRMLRSTPRWHDQPVIFLTATDSLEARLGAFAAGGDDWLARSFLDEELVARVRVRIDRHRLLRDRADRDALTGLLMRRPSLEQAAIRLAEARRHRRPLALCLIDLDHFKGVNDLYGHLAGDRALALLGRLLTSRLRVEDVRCRWGGEEFLLALPGEGAAAARAVVARVLEEYAGVEQAGDRGSTFHTSFSAGVAAFPADGESVDQLLATADRRLYLAKAGGRHTVVSEG